MKLFLLAYVNKDYMPIYYFNNTNKNRLYINCVHQLKPEIHELKFNDENISSDYDFYKEYLVDPEYHD